MKNVFIKNMSLRKKRSWMDCFVDHISNMHPAGDSFFMDLPSHLCCLAINAEQCGTAVGQIRYHLYALANGSF